MPHHFSSNETSRREFLSRAGGGFGMLALASMLADEQPSAASDKASSTDGPRPPHFAPRVKRVV